jgi:hypothetical protein
LEKRFILEFIARMVPRRRQAELQIDTASRHWNTHRLLEKHCSWRLLIRRLSGLQRQQCSNCRRLKYQKQSAAAI